MKWEKKSELGLLAVFTGAEVLAFPLLWTVFSSVSSPAPLPALWGTGAVLLLLECAYLILLVRGRGTPLASPVALLVLVSLVGDGAALSAVQAAAVWGIVTAIRAGELLWCQRIKAAGADLWNGLLLDTGFLLYYLWYITGRRLPLAAGVGGLAIVVLVADKLLRQPEREPENLWECFLFWEAPSLFSSSSGPGVMTFLLLDAVVVLPVFLTEELADCPELMALLALALTCFAAWIRFRSGRSASQS